jgi:hypothetical protein
MSARHQIVQAMFYNYLTTGKLLNKNFYDRELTASQAAPILAA